MTPTVRMACQAVREAEVSSHGMVMVFTAVFTPIFTAELMAECSRRVKTLRWSVAGSIASLHLQTWCLSPAVVWLLHDVNTFSLSYRRLCMKAYFGTSTQRAPPCHPSVIQPYIRHTQDHHFERKRENIAGFPSTCCGEDID